MTSGFFSFYQIQFPAMGAFSIEISEHMHNLNSEKRDEVDIQVASLGKIICVLVMTLTSVYLTVRVYSAICVLMMTLISVYLTGVNSDICVLIMTLMSVNW